MATSSGHPTRHPAGATIYSVAERAGVSIASVSRVLQGSQAVSEKTRKRVLEAAEELRYVPLAAARSLAVRHHEAHGLVLPELSGPYYSELLMGFEYRAAELGQSVVLMLAEGKADLPRAVRKLATRVDGLAMLGSSAIPDETVTALGGSKPVVLIAGDESADVDTVRSENTSSAREITEHVLRHGRRRVLFVGDPASGPDIRDRYAGFVAAHAAAGIVAAEAVPVALREDDGTALADRLLRGDLEADALVCANDELALAVMVRLRGSVLRVPEDVAVVGWDDVMTARYVEPGLTTVRQPVRELGARASDLLHERITGSAAPRGAQIIPTHLVIRASCGCPPPPVAVRAQP
ncbi:MULTISPECIES: LacI family DNA-binding transcriptional regulator [unclassified Phycicoccus]|jgi:LacI family transcriptional regulator|uniref:LacI family DNA-binding transcriptional regulator n=1 Tax=unclassified Phycicoccus TaxID=2637926 RepID=UPI000702F5FD|nr:MULTISPECIES: LacI family DNA-binding transcriptional regulator [unclassified Phycicoccus]KQU68106.1 LacI family transcriptional regulator [Phycicoccus sp. Root101]KQZ89960.1 LacI family transcriptional regulator [Phycicoccus sp. Root563]